MKRIKKACILGDAMIPGELFKPGFDKYLSPYVEEVKVGDWETNAQTLQFRRLEVEKKGPEIEIVPEMITEKDRDTEIAMGLFVPISSKMMEALPNLRIVGVCRAGLENVNLEEATRRGILVFNVMGRNAEAVSDFAVGLMLAEGRNIARAHFAIKQGEWRKAFSNSDSVPQLKEKTIGLVGFGFIGQLVAQKLSGFKTQVLVYDPYANKEIVMKAGVKLVSKEELFSQSDFVSIHARLTDDNKGMVGKEEFALMKPTSYFINTGRAGLVDYKALFDVLKENRIAGAALDVFPIEPIPALDAIVSLDNVTLTTHIAGTTTEALTSSPGLLMEDITKFLEDKNPLFIINPEVMEQEGFKKWITTIRK
ncbi:MAG: 2-hydroxyacid dehydrogenase [Peptostreptococcaceae bacterium]|nr:2-hydroxyacid dehydrogenase [Peptostreptococcaceae bacterium]